MRAMRHCNPQWLIKVVPLADRLYRWYEAERKRRPANRPFAFKLTTYMSQLLGCSNGMWTKALDTGFWTHLTSRKVKCVLKQYHKHCNQGYLNIPDLRWDMIWEHIATNLSKKDNTSTEWSEATYWRTRRSRVLNYTIKVRIRSSLSILNCLQET